MIPFCSMASSARPRNVPRTVPTPPIRLAPPTHDGRNHVKLLAHQHRRSDGLRKLRLDQ